MKLKTLIRINPHCIPLYELPNDLIVDFDNGILFLQLHFDFHNFSKSPKTDDGDVKISL